MEMYLQTLVKLKPNAQPNGICLFHTLYYYIFKNLRSDNLLVPNFVAHYVTCVSVITYVR